MAATDATRALEALQRLEAKQEISIIKLSETITDPAEQGSRQRASDASNSLLDGPTPAGLEADLAHYTELFAKLRFSYVEQVTKEKFIRAIVGDPPLIVTMQENLDLEKENSAAKAELKSLKAQVASMVTELEKRGRELSQRYEAVQLDTAKLQELPAKTQELEERVEKLRAAQEFHGANPNLNLPLAKTLGLVERRRAEQQQLARELEALRAKVPRKQKEAERLQAELGPLEAKLQTSTAAAREAQRRKEAALGGVADDLEQRARWWRASEDVLRQVLDLKT
ncbi:60s ribosomal protein l37 protein [Pochonia chlamydosporia 170]|uniref:60s ribosomal protein l37 protein n=1 Tax=Pochonia chlamydosporia 170 TaxID=1380566 RepID=A0A179FS59_METCM|nr:60s ribosomal protein l37 protein [Pochonia chlamydosporia 170]OAQ68476.1 60s ribosomal protein l37 protein [Pochonia chlamydosporia 170]